MTDSEVFLQQIISGLSNGMIIALLALGYTMVYGVLELVNFAHGDLFMLGAFLALTLVGALGLQSAGAAAPLMVALPLLIVCSAVFCATVNYLVDRLAYKPLRRAPRLAPLVSALGVSFIFLNIGLFWGGLPLDVFYRGNAAASPKDFPNLVSNQNLLGNSPVQLTYKDVMIYAVTLPLLIAFSLLIKYSRIGLAMRAVSQNQSAAALMGVNVDRTISLTFAIGGALAGAASVIYALYNNTIHFQMGFRVGIDAFTAAVVGGIGNLPGAALGGILIGMVRVMGDQYIATEWTNSLVFGLLLAVLIFRPNGLLGSAIREKV